MNFLNFFASLVFFPSQWVLTQEEQLDVLNISNVPFRSSSLFGATINATQNQEISEFTVCHRFQFYSYNDHWTSIFEAKKAGTINWDEKGYYETLGFKTGFEVAGYQSTSFTLYRNIPGGGLANRAFPVYHHVLLPREIQTQKWYSSCCSYSSKLQRIHMYHDGLKVFSYQYKDEQEKPLRSNFFENIQIAKNMRGFYTDLNIYSKFFEKDDLIEWTTSCRHENGDIFSWDINKVELPKYEKN